MIKVLMNIKNLIKQKTIRSTDMIIEIDKKTRKDLLEEDMMTENKIEIIDEMKLIKKEMTAIKKEMIAIKDEIDNLSENMRVDMIEIETMISSETIYKKEYTETHIMIQTIKDQDPIDPTIKMITKEDINLLTNLLKFSIKTINL